MSEESTKCRSWSTVVFTIQKSPHVNGLVQFKVVLFKGQLCKDYLLGARHCPKDKLPVFDFKEFYGRIRQRDNCDKCYYM